MKTSGNQGTGGIGQQDGLQFEICTPCPQCGGENAWGILQHMNRCRFCSSTLYWPLSGEGETSFVAQDRLGSEDAVLEALATAEAVKARSALIGQLTADVEESRLEIARAQAEERVPSIQELVCKFLPAIRVSHPTRVHVPYRVLQVTLAFHVLGRLSGDRKAYRTLFFLLEDVLPAYEKAFDFRDRGLWLSKTTLRPLTEKALSEGRFLAPVRAASERGEILKRYLRRTDLLKADIDPISYDSGAVQWREWTVFRPFHLVEAQTPSEAGWLLLDGQFGTIAGRPEQVEAGFIGGRSWKQLDPADVRPPAVRVIPFRCPQCASDLTLDTSALHQLCRECGRLLDPAHEGMRPVSYRTLEPADVKWRTAKSALHTAWLPFWAVRLNWSAQGQSGKDPLALPPLLLGARPESVPEEPPGGRLLYVPAFDAWIHDGYDGWAFDVAAALTRSAAEPADARLVVQAGVGKDDAVLPAVVGREAVKALFPKLLPAFFPPEAQARLNPLALDRLFKGSYSLEEPILVYVPVPFGEGSGGGAQLAGPHGSVGLAALRDREWPPLLCRTVRRRLEMARRPF
jgi:hypothetical protein